MKKILLGITGSIAAYKTPDLIRKLREMGFEIKVVLTENAKSFVTPMSLQVTSGNEVRDNLFELNAEASMSHIELARWPDYILIAPASANFIAKLSHGFADDLLSTLCLATQSKIILVPAMNQAMWSNPLTQENINKLRNSFFSFIGPEEGVQACGEEGFGRMSAPCEIANTLWKMLEESPLKNQRILITAGPTQEFIDPIRYLSNRSSGKMGYSLAKVAIDMGAKVTLITGPVHIPFPSNCKLIKVKTAKEMFNAVQSEITSHDIFISTAAVADYQSAKIASQKIKKSQQSLTLTLEPTIDILATIGKMKNKPFIVGFAAETENILTYAEEKRARKGADLMVVNDVSDPDIGFDQEDNAITILSNKAPITLMKAPKIQIAKQLLTLIRQHLIPS